MRYYYRLQLELLWALKRLWLIKCVHKMGNQNNLHIYFSSILLQPKAYFPNNLDNNGSQPHVKHKIHSVNLDNGDKNKALTEVEAIHNYKGISLGVQLLDQMDILFLLSSFLSRIFKKPYASPVLHLTSSQPAYQGAFLFCFDYFTKLPERVKVKSPKISCSFTKPKMIFGSILTYFAHYCVIFILMRV